MVKGVRETETTLKIWSDSDWRWVGAWAELALNATPFLRPDQSEGLAKKVYLHAGAVTNLPPNTSSASVMSHRRAHATGAISRGRLIPARSLCEKSNESPFSRRRRQQKAENFVSDCSKFKGLFFHKFDSVSVRCFVRFFFLYDWTMKRAPKQNTLDTKRARGHAWIS